MVQKHVDESGDVCASHWRVNFSERRPEKYLCCLCSCDTPLETGVHFEDSCFFEPHISFVRNQACFLELCSIERFDYTWTDCVDNHRVPEVPLGRRPPGNSRERCYDAPEQFTLSNTCEGRRKSISLNKSMNRVMPMPQIGKEIISVTRKRLFTLRYCRDRINSIGVIRVELNERVLLEGSWVMLSASGT